MCVCVCARRRMFESTYVRRCALRTHTCTRTRIYIAKCKRHTYILIYKTEYTFICIRVCVCVRVCVHVSTCIWGWVYIKHTHVHTYLLQCIQDTHIFVYIKQNIYIYIYIYIYICIYIYMFVCVCARAHVRVMFSL